MKKLLALALLAAGLISARADVVIYAKSSKEVNTGRYATFTTNYTGFYVLDLDGNVASIDVVAKKKIFLVSIYPAGAFTFNYLTSSSTKETLVASAGYGSTGGFFCKGLVASLDVGTLTKANVPASFKVSATGITDDSDPIALMTEITGTAAYDSSKTKTCNRAGNGFDATIAYLKGLLAAKGYVQAN
ncbi:MAG: hypothetical protein U1F65_05710 [Verrucomicrobiota bacterium]